MGVTIKKCHRIMSGKFVLASPPPTPNSWGGVSLPPSPVITPMHAVPENRVFFIVKCGTARFLCAMRVLEVRASS